MSDRGWAEPGPVRTARMLLVATWLQLKIVATSAFDGFLNVVWPLFFATTAFLLYRQSSDPQALVYSGLGAAVMGTWSSIATSASNLLQNQRFDGILELLVAAPTRFPLVILPMTTALAATALYSLVATLLWGRFLFGIDVAIADPLGLAVALVVTVAAISIFGLLLTASMARFRSGWAIGSMLEYPGWLVCGFLVPVSVLPDWVQWIARALPPTWGMDAIRDAATGAPVWGDIGVCAALGAAYAVLAGLLSEWVLQSARRRATLALS